MILTQLNRLRIELSKKLKKVLFFGDFGNETFTNHDAVAAKLISINPDFLVHTGDTYPTGTPARFLAAYASLQPLINEQKLLHIQGDHCLQAKTVITDLTLGTQIFAKGSAWAYFSLPHNTAFPVDWKLLGFAQTGWSTGAGLFGYGDAQTVILDFGGNTSNKYINYLFRKVVNSSDITSNGLAIQLNCDDGCEIYVNGVRVYSFNIEYPLTEDSLASHAINDTADNGLVYTELYNQIIRIPASVFTAGDNQIAVLVKNQDLTSTDISFNMSMHNYTFPSVGVFGSMPYYANGMGDGVRSIMPYLPPYCEQYTKVIGDVELFFFSTGINDDELISAPSGTGANSQSAAWLKQALAASTALYKIVVTHYTPASMVAGRGRQSLYFLVKNPDYPIHAIIHGDVHVTSCLTHLSGLVVADCSNFNTTSRPSSGSVQSEIPTMWENDYFNGVNANNIYIDLKQAAGVVSLDYYNMSDTLIFSKTLNAVIDYNVQPPVQPPGTPGEAVERIANSDNNAEQSIATGVMDLGSSDLELGWESALGQQITGLRFTSLVIPQGATIDSAFIQFTADEVDTMATTLRFVGQASDAPQFFTATNSNISARPQTTAFVDWVVPSWDVVQRQSADEKTPDLKTILQEIVNRPTYSPFDGIVIMITSISGGTSSRAAESAGGEPSQAPEITVNYTV
jgi:hypothetical protein